MKQMFAQLRMGLRQNVLPMSFNHVLVNDKHEFLQVIFHKAYVQLRTNFCGWGSTPSHGGCEHLY